MLGFYIGLGAIQKVIDRALLAIVPHYESLRDAARGNVSCSFDQESQRLGSKGRQGAAFFWLDIVTTWYILIR